MLHLIPWARNVHLIALTVRLQEQIQACLHWSNLLVPQWN